MKEDIHPDFHRITIEEPDGTRYEAYSTYGKEGSVLHLKRSYKNHPAWTGEITLVAQATGRLARFQENYGDLLSFSPAGSASSRAAG